MESLFAFFFKYRPFFFKKGEWTFQADRGGWEITLVLLLSLAFVFLVYRRRWLTAATPAGWSLVGLRTAFFLLLLFIAMRPSLVLSSLVPQENVLALLVDNSSSMGIPDGNEARGAPVVDLLSRDSNFVGALEAKFYLRFFRFSRQAQSLEAPLTLDWSGDQTNIVAGLERILAETKNLPLAGIVLFSDGSDNSYRGFKEVLAALQARRIPVHTVGLGPESLQPDIEMTQVSTARVVLPESVTSARVTFRQNGFGGNRGRLEVREGSVLVQSKEVYFPRGSETLHTEVTFTPQSEGVKTYQFTLEPLKGERIQQNNSRTTIVEVRNLKPRILYVEGHPRWEYKFIRQAVSGDKHLHLETLLRTAMNKFYRQGIEEETILAAGFPSEREELFQYRGLIFGSIESSFFTYPQLELVRDFVSKRGGGLLMLGGDSSFAAGKFQNTPIEQVLPVWLQAGNEQSRASLYAQGLGEFLLTPHGERHPALQLTPEAEPNGKAWKAMPPVTDWNLVRGLKPGTTVLARLGSSSSTGAGNQALLAFHRFGRGQGVALLTGSSWRWQMLQDSENLNHQKFWRQVLRWLVSLAKDPVSVEAEREIYSRNEPVHIRAEVMDESFNQINDARVKAVVTEPNGTVSELPLRWSAREDGVYEGEWTAGEDGLSEIKVTARGKSEGKRVEYGTAASSFLTSTGVREYFDAAQKKDFLQRLARETGGNYYTLDDVANLPEEIVYSQKQASRVEVLDLWNMPVNLLLLLSLLIGEWVLRKKHGAI
ncbi:MAG: glutamine amidotransferase [Acidobacteriota bacterium]